MTSSAKNLSDVLYTSSFPKSKFLPSSGQWAELFQIMRSNIPCSDLQIAHAHSLMADISNELVRYDQALDRRGTFSETVVSDRAELESFLHACQSVAKSLIRRLPNEILGRVFYFCHQEREFSFLPIREEARIEELRQELWWASGGNLRILSQVCSLWRGIVLDTPELWSHITLDLRSWADEWETREAPESLLQDDAMLQTALARSKAVPLKVELNAPKCHPLMLQTLVRSSSRWRSATLYFDCRMIPHLACVEGNLTSLEVLCLHVVTSEWDEDEDEALDEAALKQMIKFFSDAPRLQELDYRGPISVLENLPLKQLQQLVCNVEDGNDCLSLHRLMPEFTDLDLDVQLSLDTLAKSLPLNLPRVEASISSLGISCVRHCDRGFQGVLREVFEALTIPSLRHFGVAGEVTVWAIPVQWPHREGLALFERSKVAQNLRSLRFRDIIIREQELLECLAALPMVDDLSITDYAVLPGSMSSHNLITNKLLRKLTPNSVDRANTLAPNLMNVEFKTLGDFRDDILAAFIHGRVGHASRHLNLVPFNLSLVWMCRYMWKLGPKSQKLADVLQREGKLCFSVRDAEPTE
ncbi:hypothetical protein R3P38DRAFT_2599469 [Favolaschia claudopus]|uniref:F-box domain-containing protein n=1 Tax=Favolaschia claudopus TaxID=2862362 RepID=A0AAW0E573_9AGAR